MSERSLRHCRGGIWWPSATSRTSLAGLLRTFPVLPVGAEVLPRALRAWPLAAHIEGVKPCQDQATDASGAEG
jgi:hypothetical protein